MKWRKRLEKERVIRKMLQESKCEITTLDCTVIRIIGEKEIP
jgi:hypothetical protein